MPVITGLSGNEIYCLTQKGYTPGNIGVGNSVYSLGLLRDIGTSFKSILGGELAQVTQIIEEGRESLSADDARSEPRKSSRYYRRYQ